MSNRPKGWLAALLGFMFAPFGFLYVGRWTWALGCGFVWIGFGLLSFVFGQKYEISVLLVQLVFNSAVARMAYLQALRFGANQERPHYSRWYGLWSVALLLVVLVIGLRAFFFEPFRAVSGSMQPTLKAGVRLIAKKWGYGHYTAFGVQIMRAPVSASVERGDIFVFDYPPNPKLQHITRVVGLPGDKIDYRNKILTINGQALSRRPLEEYFDEVSVHYNAQFMEKLGNVEYAVLLDNGRPAMIPASDVFPFSNNCTYLSDGVTCLVPPGHYYVLGDNRDNSLDSRFWGFVPEENLLGKLVKVFQ